MTDEAPSASKATVVHLKDKELVEQIRERARNSILRWLRESQQFAFWWPNTHESFSTFFLGRFLGYGKNDKLDFDSVAKVLVHHSPMKFRTFDAKWSTNGYHQVIVEPRDNCEWN